MPRVQQKPKEEKPPDDTTPNTSLVQQEDGQQDRIIYMNQGETLNNTKQTRKERRQTRQAKNSLLRKKVIQKLPRKQSVRCNLLKRLENQSPGKNLRSLSKALKDEEPSPRHTKLRQSLADVLKEVPSASIRVKQESPSIRVKQENAPPKENDGRGPQPLSVTTIQSTLPAGTELYPVFCPAEPKPATGVLDATIAAGTPQLAERQYQGGRLLRVTLETCHQNLGNAISIGEELLSSWLNHIACLKSQRQLIGELIRVYQPTICLDCVQVQAIETDPGTTA